jgi:drug/metabolite transporter (DMT)-like permease
MSLAPLHVAAPLMSASIYAFAAMALKRATANGAGPWRVSFVTNWVQACLFAPVWLLGGGAFAWTHVWHAAIAGFIFFIGQILTFQALSRGDVSVTTPVLGTKVVFVAIFTVVLLRESVSPQLWGAALLTTSATALLGGGKTVAGREAFVRSLIYGFSAAAAFALTDILAKQWAPPWGFAHFAPVMFATVAVCSFLIVPRFRAPLRELPPRTWRFLIPGAILLSLQASGIAYAIMTFGEATLVNIVYATRGMFSVITVWVLGHLFENEERGHGHAVMARRLVGSGLLVVAVFLAVR